MKYAISIFTVTISILLISFKPNNSLISHSETTNIDTIREISGTFNSYYFTDINLNNNYLKDSINIAEFYPTAISNQTVTTTFAGNVTLNGTIIPFDNNYTRYLQNTDNSINMNFLQWSASGSSAINAFTYSMTPNYPKFDFLTLPDSCVKNNGINITLSNLTNTDPELFVATVILSQGSNVITKNINSESITTNSVSLSSSELAQFTNESFSIIILLQNYKYVKIGSQNYAFITSNYYKKESYLY